MEFESGASVARTCSVGPRLVLMWHGKAADLQNRSALPLPSAYCFLGRRAGLNGARGINGVGAFVDVANDAVFIDHEGDAVGKEAGEAENPVSLGHLLFGVAQQRESSRRFLRQTCGSCPGCRG